MLNRKKHFQLCGILSLLRPVNLWGTVFYIPQTCFCTLFSENFRDHLVKLKLCREICCVMFLPSSWKLNILCICKKTHHLHTCQRGICISQHAALHNWIFRYSIIEESSPKQIVHQIHWKHGFTKIFFFVNSSLQGVQSNWIPPKFSKYITPCKLAQNFSKFQRL